MNQLYLLALASTLAAISSVRAADISFSDLIQVYDGSPKSPTVTSNPPELEVSLRYTSLGAPQATGPAIFQRYPETLRDSYPSIAFSAQKKAGIGELLQFPGPDPSTSEVDTVLVTWAKAANYPALAEANPLGWEHPVSLTLYAVDASNNLTLIESITETIFVPWRPLTYPNGSTYRKSGFAFRANFQFETPVPLAPRTMIVVSFDTENSGFEPNGESGPYNELNVGLTKFDAVSVGIDDDPDSILSIENQAEGDPLFLYPSTGYSIAGTPMFRVFGPAPDSSSPDAPTDAGDYLVTATAEPLGESPIEESTPFTILPAPVNITLGDLVFLGDGTPKATTATSDPIGIPIIVTYDGATEPPSDLGIYEVSAQIPNPNYVGQVDATMVIGYNFMSWADEQITSSDLPNDMAGPLDDPDFDSIFNLAEYAFLLSPKEGSSNGTHSSGEGGTFSIIYRVNLLATDIIYSVQTTTTPEVPSSWVPVVTSDTILSTDGALQVVRAELPQGLAGERRFARVGIQQIEPTL